MIAVVVVDPQRAFVDPAGSFAAAYGLPELAPLAECLRRISSFLNGHHGCRRGPVVVVRSEYPPGSRPALPRLCVPGVGVDCELALPPSGAPVVTKHDTDAWTSPAFRATVHAWPADVTGVLVCGVTATTCVLATATSLVTHWARPDRPVFVSPLLTAARRAAYLPGGTFASAMTTLHAAGVHLLAGPWPPSVVSGNPGPDPGFYSRAASAG